MLYRVTLTSPKTAEHGQAVLAVDQGTSGTKALVVTREGRILGLGEVAVQVTSPSPGLAEVDPSELLASVLIASRKAIAQAGVPISAVSLSNQGETVMAWDPATGTPLSPMLVWHDRRAESVCESLGQVQELQQISGLPMDSYFAGPKMAWIRQHLHRNGVVTTSDVWLVHQLTGELVTDASTASRTMLLDIETGQWSPRALEILGMTAELLPEVVDSAGIIGYTNELTGAPLPLAGLIVDQQAALAGHGCVAAGEAKCTYGTGAFLLTHTGGALVRTDGAMIGSIAWQLAGRRDYCLDGQVLTVGSALRWLVDIGILPDAQSLDLVAGSVVSSDGLVFVPSFAGLAAPTRNPKARAQLTGMTLSHGAGHIARAFVEGIAVLVTGLIAGSAAVTGQRLRVLRVDGGLTSSAVLMQAQADIAQLRIEVHTSPHATALGAVILGFAGIEGSDNLDDFVNRQAPSAVYEPKMSADRAAEIFGEVMAVATSTNGGRR